MITKITDENRQSYNARFEMLNEKLAAAGFNFLVIPDEISSLFSRLDDFANAVDGDGNYLIPAEYYAMLPADEPFFEINANTRVITVPEVFKKNGLSIQNDHLAEIVYFKIDRYFDRNDLSNDTNIYIDWKIGKKEGRSEALWPTVNIDYRYLIFGWGIDKNITGEKGTLQFAVRIEAIVPKNNNEEEEQDEELSQPPFIFNTLISTININGGLNIDLNIKPISVENSIRARFINSSYTPESLEPLPELHFAENGNLPEIKYFTISNSSEAATLPLIVTLTGEVAEGRSYVYSWTEQGGAIVSHSSDQVSDEYIVTSTNSNKDRYYWVRVQGRRVVSGAGSESFYQTTPFLRSEVCCIPKAVAPSISIAVKEENGIEIGNDCIFVPVDVENGDLNSVSIDITASFTDAILPGKVAFEGAFHAQNNNETVKSTDFSGSSESIWADGEKTSFTITKTINELSDSQTYEAMAENTRNHTKAYSEVSNSLVFKAKPESNLFNNSLKVAIFENDEEKLFNENQYIRLSSVDTELRATFDIPEYFNLNECSVSYSWVKNVNEVPLNVSNESSLIITGNNAVDGVKCTAIFNYHGKTITKEAGPYKFGVI